MLSQGSTDVYDAFISAREIITLANNEQLADDFMYQAFEAHWMQAFRDYIVNADFEQLDDLDLIAKWVDLMPDKFANKVVFYYIMPKLVRMVQASEDPRSLSTMLPLWEPVVGRSNLRALFDTELRPRISSLLSNWKPEADDLLAIIRPWQYTLSRADIATFTSRYVIPRLSYSINKLEVDPSDQDVRCLQTLFKWSGDQTDDIVLVPKEQALSILRDHFLVKLVATLEQWLRIILDQDTVEDRIEGVNEVLVWLAGWRKFLIDGVKS